MASSDSALETAKNETADPDPDHEAEKELSTEELARIGHHSLSIPLIEILGNVIFLLWTSQVITWGELARWLESVDVKNNQAGEPVAASATAQTIKQFSNLISSFGRSTESDIDQHDAKPLNDKVSEIELEYNCEPVEDVDHVACTYYIRLGVRVVGAITNNCVEVIAVDIAWMSILQDWITFLLMP